MEPENLKQHTEYLFRIALKKCGNFHDAEDLTQEVLLAACANADKIRDVKAWLSTVLNHKYNDMLRRKYKLPTVCIDFVAEKDWADDVSDTATGWTDNGAVQAKFQMLETVETIPNQMISNMGLVMNDENIKPADILTESDVRREVAYLSEKYRQVIVRHYLGGEKTEKIAQDLGIPKGTVLSRLSYGREQMRKGFEMMESYEKQSYQPERLEISCHGMPGFHGEPWSLIANDLMKQNILIVAYEKPLTAVEIAKALGIPTAYIENAMKDLVASELMHEIGNKYFTNFMIETPEDMCRGVETEIKAVEENYDKILAFVNEYLEQLRENNFVCEMPENKRRKLEYYFTLHLFTNAIHTAMLKLIPSKETYPPRPDGGRWIAVGTRYPQNFTMEDYLFSAYTYGGERRACWENFMNADKIELHVYDTQPDLNRYEHGPVELQDADLAKLLYIISRGIPIEITGIDPIFCEDIPHLADCGILELKDGQPIVALPIIRSEVYRQLETIRMKYMHEMAELLTTILQELLPKIKIDIPNHLRDRVAKFRQYSCYAMPMAFMKTAISRGDFDDTNATPPMVFVVDDMNHTL